MLVKLLKKSIGFTLIELLIVLLISSILLAIAIPNYNRFVMNGYKTEAQALLQDLARAVESSYFTNNQYMDVITGGAWDKDDNPRWSFEVTLANAEEFVVRATIDTSYTDDCSPLIIKSNGEQLPNNCW